MQMGLDFNITLHLHYGGKFEEIDNFIQYVGETGCRQIEHDCDKLSLPELGSILKEDCRYEGDVREFWWQSSRKSNELRRIIGDKEVVDMISRLGKSKTVHIFTIDQTLDGLGLVTQRFADQHATMTQPARKHMVARSLFTPRLLLPETIDNEGQNSSLLTPVCGGNGKIVLNKRSCISIARFSYVAFVLALMYFDIVRMFQFVEDVT